MSTIPLNHRHRFIYHFTHIDNLASILEHGLLCTNEKLKLGLLHYNIAASGIQQRRSRMPVTCSMGGFVHDYVPFYLGSINPMYMAVINSKNVDQHEMIFLAIPIDILLEEGTVFTNASANTDVHPEFYEDPNDLDKLNWKQIDSGKWARGTDEQRHQRMAEVLIHDKLSVEKIHTIVVWNQNIKEQVATMFNEAGYKVPHFNYGRLANNNFFLLKFFFKGRKQETLITGPKSLKSHFNKLVKYLRKEKNNRKDERFKFDDIHDALEQVSDNFCAIKELKGIYELQTDNSIHTENVSDHTLKVVENLVNSAFYKEQDEEDQCILKLSAYLHDIGKGPHSKWQDGIQHSYPDHPADGVEMVGRFLYEDVKELTDYQIRMICLLVIYHDLIGEIIALGRNEQQLTDLIESRHELEMLSALNRADVAAINYIWCKNYDDEISDFLDRITQITKVE